MKTVSSLLNKEWYERYQKISKLNTRSSIYDVTNKCNLSCTSCFFYNSEGYKKINEESNIKKWEEFIDKEKARGVTLAILVGGEPALFFDRIEAFYKRIPVLCTTNGQVKIPRNRFPGMKIAISLWGDDKDEELLRGKSTFATSIKNYGGDNDAYFLYILTPGQINKTGKILQKIKDAGMKVHMELLSNDGNSEGLSWTKEKLNDVRAEMDAMLDAFPETLISSKYYHNVITTGTLFGRLWGWEECPAVSSPLDNRNPQPKKISGYIRWGADLHYMYRCGASDTRNCSACHDSAAQTTWILVNKREHLESKESLQNWIEVSEMFAKLY